MNVQSIVKEKIEIIPSTKWMNEGLITLEKIQVGAKTPAQALALRLWVFRNFILKSFEAIIAAGKITKEEASLINQVVLHHLSDDLMNALSSAEVETMQSLLLPFLEEEDFKEEEENIIDASDGESNSSIFVIPTDWLKEAIDTLLPVKRSCKNPVTAARLGNFVFSTFIYEAIYAINVRGSILPEEVELVNEIFQEYFDEHVYALMPEPLILEIETLLNPFIIESGVDDTPYRNVA
jgi:hypothetical protein